MRKASAGARTRQEGRGRGDMADDKPQDLRPHLRDGGRLGLRELLARLAVLALFLDMKGTR